ncbi:hypothetical protein R69746_07985 [Paraburkholderia aspalathi]|nr:hypothetical protein R69746_07985 [Paraburkholderia aspalathi]CAE6870891.1 hypothetical protein R75465_08267 [Paraburkholderia aspalathi]
MTERSTKDRDVPRVGAADLRRIPIALADASGICPARDVRRTDWGGSGAAHARCCYDALVSALFPPGWEELNPGEQQAAATYAQGVVMGMCKSYQPQCNKALRAVEGSAWDDAQLCALRQLGVEHGAAVVHPASPSAGRRPGEQ